MCASRWRTVEPGGPAGSSRSTTPSSAATSVASAATGFDTEASRTPRDASPCVETRPSGSTTPAAANSTGQPSIWRSACTRGDTSRHGAAKHLRDGRVRAVVGYSRAVVVGDRVYVSGTAANPADGSPPPEDLYDQHTSAWGSSATALEQAGSSLEHVVRTRVCLVSAGRLRRLRPRARRGFRRRPPCEHDSRSPGSWIRAGRSRSRSKLFCHGAESRSSRLRSRAMASRPAGASSTTRSERRPVHARRRGGVHAARRRDVRPRPAHRDLLEAVRGTSSGADHAELMQSVLEITTPVCHDRATSMRWLTAASRLRQGSHSERGIASARPGRTRSASSSASGSPRRTATAPSSTSSSTSRGAS